MYLFQWGRMNAFLVLENHASPCSVPRFCVPQVHLCAWIVMPSSHGMLVQHHMDMCHFHCSICRVLYLNQDYPASWLETQSQSGPQCPHLGRVIPGQPALTQNRSSPPHTTLLWVPPSNTSTKQILAGTGWKAGQATTHLSFHQHSSPFNILSSLQNTMWWLEKTTGRVKLFAKGIQGILISKLALLRWIELCVLNIKN